jgi:lipoyl-dependent peroxiredoxin
MERTASAVWHGGLKDGKGAISTQSGVLKQTQYSFGTRFENGIGTNPEELIAAAHAGCFTMALTAMLSGAGHPPASIHTTAAVYLNKLDAGWTINRIDLSTTGEVSGIDSAAFEKFAADAKANCPVSRALAGVEIHLTTKLL